MSQEYDFDHSTTEAQNNKDNSDEHDGAGTSRSRVYAVFNSSLEAASSHIKAVDARFKANRERTEQLRRLVRKLDEDLLLGYLNREQARDKAKHYDEELDKLDDESEELLKLYIQIEESRESFRIAFLEHLKEQQRLDYDFHKHLTTLGTGSILFIATLSGFIFTEIRSPVAISLFIIALTLLIFSIICAVLVMRMGIYSIPMGEAPSLQNGLSYASWISFSNGILFFVIYMSANLTGSNLERAWLPALVGIIVGIAIAGAIILVYELASKWKERRRIAGERTMEND